MVLVVILFFIYIYSFWILCNILYRFFFLYTLVLLSEKIQLRKVHHFKNTLYIPTYTYIYTSMQFAFNVC